MRWRWSLAPAIGLCAVGMIAGCGGDGDGGRGGAPLTLEEYVERLEAADDEAAARFDQIQSQLAENLPEDEALALLKDVYPEQLATLTDLLEEMQGLTPPEALRAAHDEAVAALADFVELTDERAAEVEDAASLRDISDILSSAESTVANERLVETCGALEGAILDLGVEVDLDCE